jgi:hypothetical protein
MATHQQIDDFPMHTSDPFLLRLVILAAAGIALVLIMMGALATGPSDDPAWKRHVVADCKSPECLSPRQFVTSGQASWMQRELGAFVLDIRGSNEPVSPVPHVKYDAHVAFVQHGEFVIGFANEAEDAMRAAQLADGQAVILVSRTLEQSILAALLLQERGHSRVMVLYA